MNLDKLTLGQLKQIKYFCGAEEEPHPYDIGKAYLIRTVTHYYTGRLIQITKNELVLEDAAWIADTGRFYQALTEGNFDEVEPYKSKVIVGRGAIVDCVEWTNSLPRDQK